MKHIRLLLGILILIGAFNWLMYPMIYSNKNTFCLYDGKGTIEDPFIIDSNDKLIALRDSVNAGENYYGYYFLQTADIDLTGVEWIPIGIFGDNHYFKGVYNGNGHCISHLTCHDEKSNNGLFGLLNGTVMNLCVRDSSLSGRYVGTITSHGTEGALILNCYASGNISATGRAGGICDNLGRGQIVNCAFCGVLDAPTIGGITSYSSRIIMHSSSNIEPYNNNCSGRIVDCLKINQETDAKKFLNDGISILSKEEIVQTVDLTVWE